MKPQYEDNIKWIKKAQENKLVVGSQARILYSDQKGRVAIALAFNEAIASKKIKVSNAKMETCNSGINAVNLRMTRYQLKNIQ